MNSEKPWGDPSQDFQAEDYNWTEAYAFHASKNKKSFFFCGACRLLFRPTSNGTSHADMEPFFGGSKPSRDSSLFLSRALQKKFFFSLLLLYYQSLVLVYA